MADLVPRHEVDLMKSNPILQITHLEIQIREGQSQIKRLEHRKEEIVELETRKIDLEIMKRNAQIEMLKTDLRFEKDKSESIEVGQKK